MKNRIILFSIVIAFTLVTSCKDKKLDTSVSLSSIIKFSDEEQAIQLLNQEDDFTKSWSQFDIDSRLGKTEGTKAEVFDLISKNVRSWEVEETEFIKSIIIEIDSTINKEGYQLPFPSEIFFIKSTTEEEGGALGYTRSNYIILNENQFSEKNRAFLTHLITHELFHVLTRNDANFKKELYALIGFSVTQPIAYPDSIASFKLTNPDAPLSDAYLTVETEEGPAKCLMILYSNRPYAGGSFFEYLNVGFLKLNEDNSIYYNDGIPSIYSMNDVNNFFRQIGSNTQYIIHPEEILADNFAFTLLNKADLPDKWLIDSIKANLKQ